VNLPAECHALLQSLADTTARLAALDGANAMQVERALTERARAIEAIASWMAAERRASRPVSPELAEPLAHDLESGAQILVRLAMDRDSTRLGLTRLSRELQMLRGLSVPATSRPPSIDYEG
jgi:hypothetical protein